jgi:hypothetical protein
MNNLKWSTCRFIRIFCFELLPLSHLHPLRITQEMLRNPGNPYLAAAINASNLQSVGPSNNMPQAVNQQVSGAPQSVADSFDPVYKAATDVMAPMLSMGVVSGHMLRKGIQFGAKEGDEVLNALHNNGPLAMAMIPAVAAAHFVVGSKMADALAENLPKSVVQGATDLINTPIKAIKSFASKLGFGDVGKAVSGIAGDAKKVVSMADPDLLDDLFALAAGDADQSDNGNPYVRRPQRHQQNRSKFNQQKPRNVGQAAGKMLTVPNGNVNTYNAAATRLAHYNNRPAVLSSTGAQANAAGRIKGTHPGVPFSLVDLF